MYGELASVRRSKRSCRGSWRQAARSRGLGSIPG